MKKICALLISSVLLLGAAGCSNPGTASSQPPTDPTQALSIQPSQTASGAADYSSYKIAVLLPGPPTDGGFCQSGDAAADAVAAKFGCKKVQIQVEAAQDVKEEAENLAAEGYKIIFGQGGEYASPFSEVAGEYPDTWFITVGGDIVLDNQFSLCLRTEEGGYVCGVMAAMMTQTNKLGRITGADYPAYSKCNVGYELGAKSVKPDIEVMKAILNNSDTNEAYETTMNQISAGADIIFCNADEGNLGSLKAVQETAGIYAFGVFGDYSTSAPDKILLNSVPDYSAAYVEAAEAIFSGAMTKGEIMSTGLVDGTVNLIWNDAMKAQIPDEVVNAVNDAIERIKAGEVDLPDEFEIGAQGLT